MGEYKGNRYIGLSNQGIKEAEDHLSVTIIHALIHSGGVEGNASGIPGTHDLTYLGKKYDDIITACQSNKSRQAKSEGHGQGEQ